MAEKREIFVDTKNTALGKVIVGCTDKGLSFASMKKIKVRDSDQVRRKPNAMTKKALKQIDEYMSGKRQTFDLPLDIEGTEFQMKVWKELNRIPYGKTRTYGDIAKRVGNPKGSRAIGMACNRNPVGIVVPCHRVVGSTGALTGYEGGLNKKEKLLQLEGFTIV